MSFSAVLFYILSAILLVSAFRVVTAKNPVHAALFLVLAFFTSAGHWLLLEAEFLAIALVLVYVGAVMVLFLFVVMMIDINIEKLRAGFWRHFPVAATVGIVMMAEMILIIASPEAGLDSFGQAAPAVAGVSNVKQLGLQIYTTYLYPFELAAVVLLLAIVAAIALTMRKRKDTKFIDPAVQIAVRREDRVRVLKMDVEKAPAKDAGSSEQQQA
ncbi:MULTISPECIES: NADH-quinone oxidoreductase subunit J [Gulbenkiania]|uniref:NADH-quinone oxidoreductase subunit J n=2 Tax=Gulbenkiania TaxID=397456 RepID=A0A0K6H7N6_9NEIS|nr:MULTISPECIES: NADH-quinone oxidoreductase subunit J [Gulbenkiania]TCW29572.1 NADH-quinone oxidoreductase subunit J [Gulbenkiania mobilis]CUA87006.1 NADH dehydrogenase subunit J [Gulbenkiania indica]